MHRQVRTVAAAALLSLLAACVSAPPRPTQPIDLNRIDQWRAHGRLGVSGPDSGGSGSFDWRQRGERADIQIRGPVGVGSVNMQLQGAGATPHLKLQTADGQRLEADAAWAELEARLGAPVPAGHLRYWMLGLAAPGEHEWRQVEGGDAVLEQSGWRIDFQKYSTAPGVRIPVRMRASHGEARVRIVIDRWRLGE